MPNTLIPIQTYTLSSTTASVTFSNIPQNYTDLYLVVSSRVTRAVSASVICMTFNGSATGYSQRNINGNGASASSVSTSNTVNFTYMETPAANATSSTFGSHSIYIPNYAGSTNKSVSFDSVSENNGTTAYANLNAGLWANTAAITSITFNEPNGNSNFLTGSTFTLYGISNGVKATGGTLTVTGGYAYHTFTSTGSFLPNQQIKGAEVLVVAGGGGGGRDAWSAARRAGGGGAGGYRYVTSQTLFAGNSYTALVGSGGSGSTGTDSTAVNGSNGSDSVFNNITSTGGGFGAGTKSSDGNGTAGGNGGSGGGGAGSQLGGTGTVGQGNNGGQGWYDGTSTFGGGGGGGAGGIGNDYYVASSINNSGGIGSNSLSAWSVITGTGSNGYYAGGGGGGGGQTGVGGAGGGGAGNGTSGTANTGGGGGGNRGGNGGAGGSGIIIVRYPLS